jgi:hypothetical protein
MGHRQFPGLASSEGGLLARQRCQLLLRRLPLSMKTLTFLSVALLSAQGLLATPRNVPKGFATTNGQTFEVDGKPFVCLDPLIIFDYF